MKKQLIALLTVLFPFVLLADAASGLPALYEYYLWENFCPDHLSCDPKGCSSWKERFDENGVKETILEDEDCFLYPYCSICEELIERVKKADSFANIPILREKTCNYAICKRCQKALIRTLLWKTATVWNEDEQCFDVVNEPKIYYKCDCVETFIDKDSCENQSFCQNWIFCGKPACFAGCFDKHMSGYFGHFLSYLDYQGENPECSCFSSEDDFRQEVLDFIYDRFQNDLLGGGITFDYSEDIDMQTIWKVLLLPYRNILEHVVHSFFYTDLRDSFRDFDRMVFCGKHGNYSLASHISHVKWELFYESLLSGLRVLYLEKYQECYRAHAHPKIAAEIKIILDEMGCDSYPTLHKVERKGFKITSQKPYSFVREGKAW